VEITTPDRYLGDVMGDLSGRRGHILGSDSPAAGLTTVKAHVPQAELHLYATDLSSLTHGHAMYKRRFHGYEQMPHEAAQKVVNEAAKAKKEEEEEA
jgi:elongation factor G